MSSLLIVFVTMVLMVIIGSIVLSSQFSKIDDELSRFFTRIALVENRIKQMEKKSKQD